MAATRGPRDQTCARDTARRARREWCIRIRWLIGATLFGAAFPIVGLLFATSAAGVTGIADAHRTQPVLYIVDLAPLVLGVTGAAIGHFHARLLRIRRSIEQTVLTRTAELQEALEDLSESQNEKDRFVASVSHELRTPLTSVVGLAHALLDTAGELPATEQRELLELIVSESEEVAAIVEDLLVAARLGNGQLTLAQEELRLDRELKAMLEVCDVNAQLAGFEPVVVNADRVRVHQIVRNLITNAQRYGGDSVVIEVYCDRDDAVLAVKDNGDGVPVDKLDEIFAPFGKAHRDPGRTDSVGLGLTVSRNLARLMGGDLVYRRRHGWTSFELRLPIPNRSRGASPAQLTSGSDEVSTYARAG